MNINNAHIRSSAQAPLNKTVIVREVCSIECAPQDIVDKVLPPNGQPEGVEPIVGDEMLHLVDSRGSGRVDGRGGAGTVGAAAEVEAGDIYACKADHAGGGGSRWGRGGGFDARGDRYGRCSLGGASLLAARSRHLLRGRSHRRHSRHSLGRCSLRRRRDLRSGSLRSRSSHSDRRGASGNALRIVGVIEIAAIPRHARRTAGPAIAAALSPRGLLSVGGTSRRCEGEDGGLHCGERSREREKSGTLEGKSMDKE